MSNTMHLILVHGACHGAWCWYKLVPKLRDKAGDRYRVTAIDLASSGTDNKRLDDVQSFSEYTKPLLELLSSIPDTERVILVGHSFGGFSIAQAMEMFSHKIAVGVFVAAFMPDTHNKPSDVFYKVAPDPSYWMDTIFQHESPNSLLFGAEFLYNKLYTLCSPEDCFLGLNSMRPLSLCLEDFPYMQPFSKTGGYANTNKVYIVCCEDKTISENYQREMINNNSVQEVKEIKDADHMSMLSRPNELLHCLLDIVAKYE